MVQRKTSDSHNKASSRSKHQLSKTKKAKVTWFSDEERKRHTHENYLNGLRVRSLNKQDERTTQLPARCQMNKQSQRKHWPLERRSGEPGPFPKRQLD
ncbi:hypothetical protein TNCV_398381 [Trichonephila clavipes]|nr:hypothetical protein TNCV_398381 [Trichonephila clavipes]